MALIRLYGSIFICVEKSHSPTISSFSIASNVNSSCDHPIDQSKPRFNFHVDKIKLSVWRQKNKQHHPRHTSLHKYTDPEYPISGNKQTPTHRLPMATSIEDTDLFSDESSFHGTRPHSSSQATTINSIHQAMTL